MDKPKRTQEDVFRDMASKIAEQYPDYVLMVRCPDGGRAWKFSDANWAYGACHRLAAGIDNEDFNRMVEESDESR